MFKENKIIYKGNWDLIGNKQGFGICLDIVGNKYIGYWKNNKYHGKGRLISINGDYYEGDFVNGNIEGTGTFYNSKEKYTYVGGFLENKFNGIGEIIYQNTCDGEIHLYKGNFKNGCSEGKGKLEYNNGNYYEGEFINNCFNGNGCFFFNNGSYYK